MFSRVLVANRGEIALRVMRSASALGWRTVAIHTDLDRAALHVRAADAAVRVESYLNAEAILAAAQKSEAQAIHPGYGFLSENPAFARACRDEGIVFVGPSPEAMALMGDKVAARQLAASVGVPTVPGTPEPVTEDAAAAKAAAAIGYPLLIKAAAGGGGKGMRAVRSAKELLPSLAQARSEAAASFGDGSVYLEKLVERPRHIEVQLFGDGTGRVEHLGERECSIQRRYQKVVEESPAPDLPDDVRRAMWRAAVDAASAAKYAGAGTIEFLYESSTQRFYFLEMNARLQVEHPVTEQVTGVDLVQAQLRLASGSPLDEALWGEAGGPIENPKSGDPRERVIQNPVHAIEARIYAEDPFNSWLPSTGTLGVVRESGGLGVRVDSACEPGQEVTVYYDPLLAKLIAWGRSRDEAIARLRRALDEYLLTGVRTSLPFHRWLVRDEAFLKADLSTAFIAERWRPDEVASAAPENQMHAAALVAAHAAAPGRLVVAPRTPPNGRAPLAGAAPSDSNWRRAARRDALR